MILDREKFWFITISYSVIPESVDELDYLYNLMSTSDNLSMYYEKCILDKFIENLGKKYLIGRSITIDRKIYKILNKNKT